MNTQFFLALNFAMHYLSYWWQAKDVIILSDEFTFVCLCVPSFVIRFDQFLSVYFLFCFVVALEISNDQYFLLYIIFISYFNHEWVNSFNICEIDFETYPFLFGTVSCVVRRSVGIRIPG